MGQRHIQKWFSDVKDADYTLIGQVDDVFVYKLKNNIEPKYTYITRKTQINETAEYSIPNLLKCHLDGDGTADTPYLINSETDLIEFRDLVNSGYSFRGEYVQQTKDIHLNIHNSWEPIGIYTSGKLFEGNYNGDGYSITGLYINLPEENVGLFGQLAGTVENVSLIDCNISGACIGGIASHGIGGAAIINCYVSGTLKGNVRSGGIADNLSGYIINCVTDCTFTGNGINSGISGYYTNTVLNCYSNLGNEVSIDDGYQFVPEKINELNSFLSVSEISELLPQEVFFNSWESKSGKAKLRHKYSK